MRLSASRADGVGLTEDLNILPRTARKQDRQDRLIPLINIVFLLLTFFLVIGTFRAADTLSVNPPLFRTEGRFDPGGISLLVDKTGEIVFGKKRLTEDNAIVEIQAWLARDPDGELQIKADRAVNARMILSLLRKLSQAGITSVRLVAIQREGKP